MAAVLPSHPDYAELNHLQTLLCLAYNPHLYPLAMDEIDIATRYNLIDELERAQGDLLYEYEFRELTEA